MAEVRPDEVSAILRQQLAGFKTEKELEEVLEIGGVQRIMLDNFSPEKLRDAIRKIDGRFITEASGGINETTLRAYAETGVDFISVGALTHHIKSLDLSLKAKWI